MPNRWPISSGNWSDAAIWSGSIIPTASDDVFANNQTVNIDTNIVVLSLNNSATGSAVAGGSFYANNNTQITSSINSRIASGTVLFITGSNSCIIVGNITHTANVNNGTAVRMQDSANLIVSGNISINTSTNSGNTGIQNAGTGTLRVTGSITTIAGGGNQVGILNSSTGTAYFIGTINNNRDAQRVGIRNASNGTIYVTGSLLGNSVLNEGLGGIYISGSVAAIATSVANVITSTSNGIISVIGPISSSISASAIVSTGTNAINLFTGPFYNTGSWNAVYAFNMQMLTTSSAWTVDLDNGTQRTLVTPNQLAGYPAASNVRSGTTYGPQNEFTGSLIMPDPATVKTGVATDNTTGSAVLTAQDFYDILTQNITATGSVGELLTRASTVQTTGATISAFKV